MAELLKALYETLYALVGYQKKLLEIVRSEKESLVSANLRSIQAITALKESVLSEISLAEERRIEFCKKIAEIWKASASELTLTDIIREVQGSHPTLSSQLHSVHTTLKLLVKRILEQNKENNRLVTESLHHVRQMKKNVLGEATPNSETYSKSGKTVQPSGEARLLSQKI